MVYKKLKLPRKVKKEALNYLVIGWVGDNWGYRVKPRIIPNKYTKAAIKVCNAQVDPFCIGKYHFIVII